MSKTSRKVAVAYVPVLHKGYIDFIDDLTATGVTQLWLVGDSILEAHEELDYINRKDRLRAVPVRLMQSVIETITDMEVRVLEVGSVLEVDAATIIVPREDISEVIASHYFTGQKIEYRDVFVRRNHSNIGEQKTPQAVAVSLTEFETKLWAKVFDEAKKSADWWRQVGAALVKEGEIVCITHNQHMPEAQLPNIEGDARSLFKKGVHITYVTSAHAEVAAIGEAARAGVSTEGAELYVTDFPCPYCARLIAASGISKVYFVKGYAVLDGDTFLKEANVELVQVHVGA